MECIRNLNFVIETTTEIPKRKLPYKLTAETNNRPKEICDEMESAGFILKDESGTWCSPAFLINENGREIFIVDYSDLSQKQRNSISLRLCETFFQVSMMSRILCNYIREKRSRHTKDLEKVFKKLRKSTLRLTCEKCNSF